MWHFSWRIRQMCFGFPSLEDCCNTPRVLTLPESGFKALTDSLNTPIISYLHSSTARYIWVGENAFFCFRNKKINQQLLEKFRFRDLGVLNQRSLMSRAHRNNKEGTQSRGKLSAPGLLSPSPPDLLAQNMWLYIHEYYSQILTQPLMFRESLWGS